VHGSGRRVRLAKPPTLKEEDERRNESGCYIINCAWKLSARRYNLRQGSVLAQPEPYMRLDAVVLNKIHESDDQ
jgi:hypothetical protein